MSCLHADVSVYKYVFHVSIMCKPTHTTNTSLYNHTYKPALSGADTEFCKGVDSGRNFPQCMIGFVRDIISGFVHPLPAGYNSIVRGMSGGSS